LTDVTTVALPHVGDAGRPARLDAANTGEVGDGMILEYTNRVTGGPVMPTIACHMQLLRPGEQTLARRLPHELSCG